MGRYSKRSKRGSARDRMRYERSAGDASPGYRTSKRGTESSLQQSRIAREAKNAELSTMGLSAAKSLEKTPATLMAERDRRKRRTRKRILVTLAVLGTLLFATVAAGALYYMNLQSRMTVRTVDFPAIDSPAVAPGDPFNLVIFGDDSRDADEVARADTIILMRVDPAEQEVWMVSIPRDARVELLGYGPQKINSATAFGGKNLAIEAIEDLSGHEIDFFMTVNFWGFEEIVDSIGGIYIDVPYEINDPRADFTPDKSASRIAPGLQNLNGAHALTFVRTRAYQDGDFGRMNAQQLFFRALLDQMTDVPTTRLPGVANSLADNVTTNFTLAQLLQLARDMRGIDPDNLHATTLPGEWRTPYVWLDYEEAAIIWNNFGERPFNEETDEETRTLSLDPSEVSMTVRNGTTRAGIASEGASIMRARGFIVNEVGNTSNQTVYDENLIVYTDNRDAAELAARFMPEPTRIVQSRGMFTFNTDILVILGTEWDIGGVPVADIISE